MPKKKKKEYISKLEYNNTYNRNNYRSFSVRLNNEKEAEVIEWLESKESLKQYLMELVQKDMEKAARRTTKKATKSSHSKVSKKK